MKKLLRHKWIEQDGFRVHKCYHCATIRYWDSGYQRLMFKWMRNWKWIIGYKPPECKRIMHCDKILN